jgi:hypothetical protein
VRRTGDKGFGVAAIVAGIGLIAAVIAGVEVSNVVLILIPLVIIGWSVYHYVAVRPFPMGRKASRSLGRSRGALAELMLIDREEDRGAAGCCVRAACVHGAEVAA